MREEKERGGQTVREKILKEERKGRRARRGVERKSGRRVTKGEL